VSNRRSTRIRPSGRKLRLLVPIGLLGIVLVVFGGLVVGMRGDSRAALRDRFEQRAAVGTRFLETFTSELVRREREEAQANLAGRKVNQSDFERSVERLGFEAAVLLDEKGRLLAVTPYRSDIIGTDLTKTYRHLAQASAGRVGISVVVPSAAKGDPVVAFATPFETPFGRRVISGGHTVDNTPLRAYVGNLSVINGTRAYLVDVAGTVVASSESVSDFAKLSEADPALARAYADARRGSFESGEAVRFFAASGAKGSPWVLIASVPESELFAPVQGVANWLPWLMLVTLAGAILVVSALFIQTSRQRLRLAATLQEADRLNDALAAFSGRVAHDLRGPLGTVKMYLDLLEGADEATIREVTPVLDKAADRGMKLIEDLLELAKAAGTPQPESLQISHVVEAAIVGIGSVDVRVEDGVSTVFADRVGLTQALHNLVSNSARYGRSNGRAHVTIESIARADGWLVAVSDDGPGVTAADAERLFEAFYRGPNDDVQGTGLGLAIVASFAESHGGHAWCDTDVDRGARFVMFLPKPSGRQERLSA
jgi:signal transduction histidine kinase